MKTDINLIKAVNELVKAGIQVNFVFDNEDITSCGFIEEIELEDGIINCEGDEISFIENEITDINFTVYPLMSSKNESISADDRHLIQLSIKLL